MERIVLLGDIFAKPYGEYFVDDSFKQVPSFGSSYTCCYCGDVIDSQSMCFVVSESMAL